MCAVIQINTEVKYLKWDLKKRKDFSRKGKEIILLQRDRMIKMGERWEKELKENSRSENKHYRPLKIHMETYYSRRFLRHIHI